MSASEKLERLDRARSGLPLDVGESLRLALPEIIAVVKAAEQIYSEQERVPVNHKTGVRPDHPRYIHEWRTRALLERPLVALDRKLEEK